MYAINLPGTAFLASSMYGKTWNCFLHNGRELFYRNGNKMMAVEVATETAFSAGTPKLLFEGGHERSPVAGANYDVTPDGQRFVMIQAGAPDSAATQINVVLNWFEELKQRVPTGN